MNLLAEKLGIKTYPIQDGMVLSRRTPEEYQYLIEHGFLTHWHRKYMILKKDERYQLLRNVAPEPELEGEAPTLEALVMTFNLPLAQFQWHPYWEDDPC